MSILTGEKTERERGRSGGIYSDSDAVAGAAGGRSRRKAVNGMRKNDNTASAVQRKAYKISVCAVLTALALIFSYVEALFPFQFGIPGMKLGLSNLVVLVALYGIGASYALSVNLARILLSGLLFGGVSAMMYSLAEECSALSRWLLLKKTRIFRSSRSQHGRRREPTISVS